MLGAFRENARTRMEFLDLIKRRSQGAGSLEFAPPGLSCVTE
jgi:hypothetical protein